MLSLPLLKPAPRARSPTLLDITMNSRLGTNAELGITFHCYWEPKMIVDTRAAMNATADDQRTVCAVPSTDVRLIDAYFLAGASTTAASAVRNRKVKVSCRYRRTAVSEWLR